MIPESIPAVKVVVAGDGSVGKTSLIRRYCEGKFAGSRVMTIGVDFQTKVVQLANYSVKLSIWDMAGQERFAVMRTGFYRGSRAAALVFDLNNPQTFANLDTWREEITRVVPEFKFVLIGNKADLNHTVSSEAAQAYATRYNATYVETSAATGQGVPQLFEALATLAHVESSVG